MKNEKVAQGRIIGLAGPCFYPEDLYLPLVGRFKCPTVVTDISFGCKFSNEGLNGYHGQKNLKNR